jgi:hypothetical protein
MCGSNPVDDFSDFIGTGGGDQGLLNVVDEGVQGVSDVFAGADDLIFQPVTAPISQLTSALDEAIIQPVTAPISDLGVSIDDTVAEVIPGGWGTVAQVAAAIATMGQSIPIQAAAAAAAAAGSDYAKNKDVQSALEKAAIAGTTRYGLGTLGSGTEFTGSSETGLATLPGEGVAADLAGTTILGDLGLEGATESAIGEAFTTPVVDAPINQYELSPRYDFSPNVPIEYVSPEYDPTGSLYTEARAPIYDFSPTVPVEYVSPELDPTGSLATAGGISAMDVLRGVNAAKGLLGSGQEQAVAPATQFRGTRVPQGQVDYSGILSLLQMQSPQRRSLLG